MQEDRKENKLISINWIFWQFMLHVQNLTGVIKYLVLNILIRRGNNFLVCRYLMWIIKLNISAKTRVRVPLKYNW